MYLCYFYSVGSWKPNNDKTFKASPKSINKSYECKQKEHIYFGTALRQIQEDQSFKSKSNELASRTTGILFLSPEVPSPGLLDWNRKARSPTILTKQGHILSYGALAPLQHCGSKASPLNEPPSPAKCNWNILQARSCPTTPHGTFIQEV